MGQPPMSRYVPAEQRRKVGHITPSSNTVLEPLTMLMSRDYDARASHHFTRIKVDAITLEPRHTGQFSSDAMLAAAELLAALEEELGKPVFDSVAVTLWKALTMVGIKPRLHGWGRLLAGHAIAAAPGR
jgi:maleate cis-trans isomerase